jgi:hypothetical protein
LSTLSAKAEPPSLFTGVLAAAASALGVSSVRHLSALIELCDRDAVASDVVARIYETIAANWRQAQVNRKGRSSRENWRWRKPQTYLAAHNSSSEVTLERAIAAWGTGWANQVPICSGAAGASADRRRSIDLVCQVGDGHFQFIELKIASDTPLYAAIEIIGYGCVWLLSRVMPNGPDSELLTAERVDLLVLAPASYYDRFRLDVLATALHEQVSALGGSLDVQLSFRFEVLPEALAEQKLPRAGKIMAALNQRRAL